MNWSTMDNCPRDRMVNMFCPGVSPATKGVLQGLWNDRLQVWTLNPYGTTQFITLFPSRWCEIEEPPAKPAE